MEVTQTYKNNPNIMIGVKAMHKSNIFQLSRQNVISSVKYIYKRNNSNKIHTITYFIIKSSIVQSKFISSFHQHFPEADGETHIIQTLRSNCYILDAKVESHYAIYLHSQKKDVPQIQKSANRTQWSLLRLLRCSLSSTKVQYLLNNMTKASIYLLYECYFYE